MEGVRFVSFVSFCKHAVLGQNTLRHAIDIVQRLLASSCLGLGQSRPATDEGPNSAVMIERRMILRVQVAKCSYSPTCCHIILLNSVNHRFYFARIFYGVCEQKHKRIWSDTRIFGSILSYCVKVKFGLFIPVLPVDLEC